MAPRQFSRKEMEAALAKGKANAAKSGGKPKRVRVSERQRWFLNKAGHSDEVIDSKVRPFIALAAYAATCLVRFQCGCMLAASARSAAPSLQHLSGSAEASYA